MSQRNRDGRDASMAAAVRSVGHNGGPVTRWESRRRRKHPGGSPPALRGGRRWPGDGGSPSCSPSDRCCSRWGALPGYASAVATRWDKVTFFVGSLFFTSAAFLTYREAVDASSPAQNPTHRRFFIYQPRRIAWWATAVQLVGTVYFNVSTASPGRRPLYADRTSARVAARRHWLDLLPGGQCACLVRSLPWLGRLAPPVMGVVDNAGQPVRVRRLRSLRCRQLRHPGDRRAA